MTEKEQFDKWWNNRSPHSKLSILKEEQWAAWQAARRWIPTIERLPEKSGVPVIAYGYNEYGKLRRLRAAYVHKHTIEDLCEDYTGDTDYCEENDTEYWPEGWFEWNEFEDTHWKVDFDILGWQPLPEVLEEAGKP